MSDVLIVGAGPSGLALAYELKRRHISVRIIDKREGPSVHSKALAIQARSLELLEQIGIVDDFLNAGLRVKGALYHSKSKSFCFSLSEIDTPYPFLLILPQSETEKILIKHFEQIGGKVEWQTTLLDIIENKGLVENHTKKKEIIDSPWIVGCDGAHSRVREILSFSFKGAKFPETTVLADVRAVSSLDRNYAHFFLDEEGIEAVFPLPKENGYRLVVRTPKKIHDQEEVASFFKNKDSIQIEAIEWFSEFQIHRRMTPHLRRESLFLAGDAAHLHSPVGGQGLNTSIQDAINLAWKLALVIQGTSSENLLDTYEAERLPIAKGILKGTTRATRLITYVQKWGQKWGRALFFGGLRFLLLRKKFRLKMKRALSELSVNYQNSPIVHMMSRDRDWKGPKPGDRAPDGYLSDGTRLFELFKTTNHVLLLFEEHKTFAGAIQQEYGSWINIHVVKGEEITKKYNAESDSLYLIRPDGYIGYRSRAFKTKEFVAYLLRIFKPASQRSKL